MILSKSFTLDELTKSQEAIRLGITNEPSDEHITNLILLCKNILQPSRNHFKIPVSISSGYRSAALMVFSLYRSMLPMLLLVARQLLLIQMC
jgi:zinc D-Ala-D-Ala carboxypeptidase